MAQTILTLCDYCLARGEETPATTWTVQLLPPGARKAKGFDVDACADCAKPFSDLLESLPDVARTAGSPPVLAAQPVIDYPAKRASPGANPVFACPECGREYGHRSSLDSHAKREHGKRLAELLHPSGLACPDCDFTATNGTGLAAHRRAAHGWVKGQA